MALQKTSTYKGITLNYWKIIEGRFNVFRDKTIVILAGYVNEEARRFDEKSFLTTETVMIDGVKDIEGAYPEVKTDSKFATSIDC